MWIVIYLMLAKELLYLVRWCRIQKQLSDQIPLMANLQKRFIILYQNAYQAQIIL